jgi:hypothetical protein
MLFNDEPFGYAQIVRKAPCCVAQMQSECLAAAAVMG